MTNSPAHSSSSGSRGKQSLLISPSGTSSLPLLHHLLLFLCIPAAEFSALEQNQMGTCKQSFSILAEAQRDILSAAHPDLSSFTLKLTPQWLSIPRRQGLCRSAIPLLSKLSVYINPSTFTQEVYKPPRSCSSLAVVTFQTAEAIREPSNRCCCSISF